MDAEAEELLYMKLDKINAKLDRILAYIDLIESPEYKRRVMEGQFEMNVAANVVGERLGEAIPWGGNNNR